MLAEVVDIDGPITYDVISAWYEKANIGLIEPLTIIGTPFTKANGTLFARIYERLTKASRRREDRLPVHYAGDTYELGYRQATYDVLKALQSELT